MNVLAVVVTHNPEPPALAALLDALEEQADGVVVVDNGSGADVGAFVAARGRPREEVVLLGGNLGVAAAQNRGIEIARRCGFGYVVLFDQDSLPAPGMVGILHRAAEGRRRHGETVAAVGPRVVEAGAGRRLRPAPAGDVAPDGLAVADHVIASGCLMPLAALERAGLMRAELFIDWVDVEWCLRARAAADLRCYVAGEALLTHAFGEPVAILGRTIVSRPPVRHYYYFRNATWLLGQRWVPRPWRLRSAGRVLRRLAVCLVLTRPRRAQWRMAWHGIADGIAGRLGKGPA